MFKQSPSRHYAKLEELKPGTTFWYREFYSFESGPVADGLWTVTAMDAEPTAYSSTDEDGMSCETADPARKVTARHESGFETRFYGGEEVEVR
jgi:hypothetical protein